MRDLPHQPHVIQEVVADDLCIGCGVCAGACPRRNLLMKWDSRGFLRPRAIGECPASCGVCVAVCPFGGDVRDEDTIAEELYAGGDAVKHSAEAGFWRAAYIGSVAVGEYRERGASGGLASWVLCQLLERGAVDRVACVASTGEPECLFRFAVCDSPDEVRRCSKSAYYPVELSGVLRTILDEPARYAIIALPCFAKALRLAASRIPDLRDRLSMVCGLVCSQLKSRSFADYLVLHAGLDPQSTTWVSFREKVPDRPASNGAFAARAGEQRAQVDRVSRVYGQAWGIGQFKPRACDFCDDVFAETADVVFMDAWLPDYVLDWRGASIVVTRSAQADELVRLGVCDGELALGPVGVESVLRSQRGPLLQKRVLLANRLWLAEREGRSPTRKRVAPCRPGWPTSAKLRALEGLRQASDEAVAAQRLSSPTALQTYHATTRDALRRVRFAEALERLARVPRGLARRLMACTGRRR